MIQKLNRFNIYLIILCLPLYLARFCVWKFPTNVLELIVITALFIWLGDIILTKQFRKINLLKKEKELLWPIILIVTGMTISTVFSKNISTSFGIWKGWLMIPLCFFIFLINNIKTKNHIRNIILSITISGVIVSIISIYYRLNGYLTYDGRLKVFYLSPNYLAMFLSPILILSIYLYFCFKSKVAKILLFLIQCLLLVVVYWTNSYGALFGILGALFLIIVLRRQSQNNRLFLYFLLFFIFISILFLAPSQKFQGLLNFNYPSLGSRLLIWRGALEIIKDHSLLGIGPGMFQKYFLEYQISSVSYAEWAVPQPHNIFLAFWLQAGIIGLVGFIWIIKFFFKNNYSIISTILTATMGCILLHGLVDTTYWKNDLSMIFWLIVALGYIARYLSYSQK